MRSGALDFARAFLSVVASADTDADEALPTMGKVEKTKRVTKSDMGVRKCVKC